MVVATASIKVFASAENGSVSEIEPKVLSKITHLTLPTSWGHFLAIVQLLQIVSKPKEYLVQKSQA
jgi:hypothetical protein